MFQTLQTLKATCLNCHRLVVDDVAAVLLLAQCRLLKHGLIAEVAKLEEKFAEAEKGEDRSKYKDEIEHLTGVFLKGDKKSYFT